MPPKPPASQSPPARRCTMVPVALPADLVTRPVFGRHGFASGALIADWAAIVGSAVATHTLPVRIRFPGTERRGGTLIVKVASGGFALELQHLEPLVIERINAYFGWKAVDRLRLIQGPLPEARPLPPPVPPCGPEDAALDARLATIEDPELRAVLARLGRRLAGAAATKAKAKA